MKQSSSFELRDNRMQNGYLSDYTGYRTSNGVKSFNSNLGEKLQLISDGILYVNILLLLVPVYSIPNFRTCFVICRENSAIIPYL